MLKILSGTDLETLLPELNEIIIDDINKTTLLDKVSGILCDGFTEISHMFNNSTEIDLETPYNNLLENDNKENIDAFNEEMEKMELFSNWAPAFTNCLIEPLKIIFNFRKFKNQ